MTSTALQLLPGEAIGSKEVSRITGASLRQLQWWDEHGLICPTRSGHRRQYTPTDLAAARIVVRLRKTRFPVGTIRRALRRIRRNGGLQRGLYTFEWPSGNVAYHADAYELIKTMARSKEPLVLVDLSGEWAI